MNNFDKEATKLNAINMLARLAISEPFISRTEEMIYISKKSHERVDIVNTVSKHICDMDIEDQLLLGRVSVLIGEVANILKDKYGMYEGVKSGKLDWKPHVREKLETIEIPFDLFVRLMELDKEKEK